VKRDMDLIRKMLLAIENSPSGYAPDVLTIEGYTPDQIGYHAFLMLEAGLVDGSDITDSGSSGPEALITRLTWKGHEFAEAARDESRWTKAMGIVKEKGGTITMDVLKELLTSLMRATLGLG
jgi:hypothetical protein